MLTIFLALFAATLVTGAIKLSFVHSSWSLLFPFFATAIGVVVFLFRRVSTRFEPIIADAQRHLVGGRRELALKSLRDGLSLGRWHPLIGGQLRAQIGALHYDSGELDEAESELSRAGRWPWTSRALLGCLYFKKRDEAKMKKAFDTAVKVGDKEPIVWTLYAYCLIARGERDAAVKLFEKALQKNPGDQRLQTNLELAKEGKKLKTAPYGEKWSRFGLEGEGPVLPKAARGFAVRPGFRQKARYKK